MSVEGMWAIFFGDVDETHGAANSGIIVLETEKVFGGDSSVAYVGSYVLDGQTIRGTARTWWYNPTISGVSAFGKQAPFDIQVGLEATVRDESISGVIWEADKPDVRLPVLLKKISELP